MSESFVELKRAAPESTGLSSASILAFVNAIESAELELHSLMILKGGNVVAEGWWAPYRAEDVHLLYSLSKSFTSTAIGFAVQEGLVDIDAPVISYFPDQLPETISENLAKMKVRHLLSMSSGHDTDEMSTDMVTREDGDWVRGFLARAVPHEPGTHFLYNNGATYTLSAIVTKVTGLSALDYLRPRLLDPLGIEEAVWTACPKGINIGASQLHVTTESIARFGQFYLNRGVWEGKRLLSEEWIDLATSFQVSNGDDPESDWAQGYGFQFWRCRHNCYRGDGAFGQYCVVIAEFRMVVAITGSVSDMGAVLHLIWKHLYDGASVDPLPENAESRDALASKMSSLSLPGPTGPAFSPMIANVGGRLYHYKGGDLELESCILDFDASGSTLTIRNGKGDRSIRAGSIKWVWGVTSIENPEGRRISSIGAWTAEDTYEIKVRYTDSPSGIVFVARFGEESLTLTMTLTARFGPPQVRTFEGVR